MKVVIVSSKDLGTTVGYPSVLLGSATSAIDLLCVIILKKMLVPKPKQ